MHNDDNYLLAGLAKVLLRSQKVVPTCSQISEMKEALLQILGDGDLIPDVVRFSNILILNTVMP